MTTALERRPAEPPPVEFGEKSKEMFRKLIAPGAPDDQVALVYHYAKALHLDPLRRQVMLISFRKKEGDNWIDSYVIVVGVHGMLAKCSRHPEWGGIQSGVVYPGESCKISADQTVVHEQDVTARGKSRPGDDLANRTFPLGAWATCTRLLHGNLVKHTIWLPFAQAAMVQRVDEWKDGKKTGRKISRLRDIWDKYPDWMIEKSAISFALRKAFDDVLSGFYSAEEFGGRSLPDGAVEAEAAVVIEDDVTIADEEATPVVQIAPGMTPAAQAGAITGTESAKPVHVGQVVQQTMKDLTPTPGAQPDRELRVESPDPPEELSDDEIKDRLLKAGKYGEHACQGRPFIAKQSETVHWIIDADVLRTMKRHAATHIEKLTRQEMWQALRAIQDETQQAMARGRR